VILWLRQKMPSRPEIAAVIFFNIWTRFSLHMIFFNKLSSASWASWVGERSAPTHPRHTDRAGHLDGRICFNALFVGCRSKSPPSWRSVDQRSQNYCSIYVVTTKKYKLRSLSERTRCRSILTLRANCERRVLRSQVELKYLSSVSSPGPRSK